MNWPLVRVSPCLHLITAGRGSSRLYQPECRKKQVQWMDECKMKNLCFIGVFLCIFPKMNNDKSVFLTVVLFFIKLHSIHPSIFNSFFFLNQGLGGLLEPLPAVIE